MNGVAERVNRTLIRIVIVILVDSGMPVELWELAMAQATQIHNKVPHRKLGMKSPYFLLHKREPSLKFIYRFGSKAYSLIPYAEKRTRGSALPLERRFLLLVHDTLHKQRCMYFIRH